MNEEASRNTVSKQKQDPIEKTSFLQTFIRFSLRVAGARRLNKSVHRLLV